MGNNRSKVPDLEKLVKGGRKKFVRYEEGAMLYSMGIHTFQQLAKDARAVYHHRNRTFKRAETLSVSYLRP